MIRILPSINTIASLRSHKLVFFLLPMFFLLLADASLSFVFPLAVIETLGSNSSLGIIMALSSVAGILFDAVLPIFINTTKWIVKFMLALFIAGLFPVLTYLGVEFKLIYFFIGATIVWGLYFELLSFSVHEFIVTTSSKRNFTFYWGIISAILTISVLLGPVLGGFIYSKGILYFTYAILVILVISFIFSLFSISFNNKKSIRKYKHVNYFEALLREIKIWRSLSLSASSVFIVSILISIIDAVYWTIGGLLSVSLFKGDTSYAYVIMLSYTLAFVIGQYMVAKSGIYKHKKLYSNIFIILGSIILVSLTTIESIFMIILLIFISSLCFAASRCFNRAVVSDVEKSLRKDSEYLIAFTRLQTSFACIVGPLAAGYLSDAYGYINTFRILGVFALFIGIILMFITPKKLVMPVIDYTD